MQEELEFNILRYFFQHKKAIDYLPYGISSDIFLDPVAKNLFEVYVAYVNKYKCPPDSNNFITFLRDNKIEDKIIKILKGGFDVIYKKLDDIGLVEEHLLKHVKKVAHLRAVQESLESFDDSWTEAKVTELYKKISRIDQLDIHGAPKSEYLLTSIADEVFAPPTIKPTCFNNFNKIIGMGGFFAPQLITILGGAKSMKTTFMLHLAAGYAKEGEEVAYLDWENGRSQIGTVIQQILVSQRVEMLYADWNKKLLQERVHEILSNGGNINYIRLRAKRDRVTDAETILDECFDTTGVYPSVICYDYLDITGADKTIKDRREKIQMAYADAKNLNEKCNAFGITVSKMVAGAAKKDYHDEDDAGEDKEKAYNVDAMFSLHRTTDDVEQGIGWVQPILQRVGESRSDEKVCFDMDGATRYIADNGRKWSDV